MKLSPARQLIAEDEVVVGGRPFALRQPPPGFTFRPEAGVLAPSGVAVRRIHIDDFVCHPRAIKTRGGDYLLLYAAGPMHYGWARKETRGNVMYACRSTDRGENWTEPEPAWDVPYSQHAAILFQPRGSLTLYAFGTEPHPDHYDGEENAAIAYRCSADEGRTWGKVNIIRPQNDPEFRGMSAMRMCETESGTWLLGSHTGEWSGEEGVDRRVQTRQYLLRSEDEGRNWVLHPGARPDGWFTPGYDRMDEGRPLLLNGNQILLMVRTPAGSLWELRSGDDGKTWSEPSPTSLVHPDAPPMLFDLDARTLIAFHHNRRGDGMMSHESRTELWFSLSTNQGASWTSPRFLLANAVKPAVLEGWGMSTPMVSYADLLVDGEDLHLFIDHQARQILHLHCQREDLFACPTIEELNS